MPSRFRNCSKLLLRRQPIFALNGDVAGRQFIQTGDTHHVEFVEIAVGDRQEPHPLEERMAWITGFFENPLVEGKPGQLTIDVALLPRSPDRPSDLLPTEPYLPL